MDITAFTQAEIKDFQTVLQEASDETIATGADVPVELMAKRLFKAAEQGLRDPDTLKAVALGKEAWPPTGKSGQGPLIDPTTLATRS